MKQWWKMTRFYRVNELFSIRLRQKMNRLIKGIVFIFCAPMTVYAAPIGEGTSHQFFPSDAPQASWVFSGIVTSENGEDYGYFFQLQRDKSHFRANVALMDQTTNTIVFQEDSEADIEAPIVNDWHVGRTFLQYNPVNESWIFGVKPKNNLGFNFKVDMLKQFEETPSRHHHLRQGFKMMVSRTNALNGHIMTGTSMPEQFVTTKSSWFRQIWQEGEQEQPHNLSSVLCQFNDGSRFYAVNLKAKDAQSGAIAGWYNAEGDRQAVSQFVQVNHENKAGAWHIQSRTPRLDLTLINALEQSSVAAGFVNDVKQPGFCLLNHPIQALDSFLPKIG